MKGMHYFVESKREKLNLVNRNIEIDDKYFLEFLFDISKWTKCVPLIYTGIKSEDKIFYVLFREIVFFEYEFWDEFNLALAELHDKYKIDIFGTELYNQETVHLFLDKKDDNFFVVQKNVSGKYVDTIYTLCLRIELESSEHENKLFQLSQKIDWENGLILINRKLRNEINDFTITSFYNNSYFLYSYLYAKPTEEEYFNLINFENKIELWRAFLKTEYDYEEFKWLFNRIIDRKLENRIEWELALYNALDKEGYSLNLLESRFELYNNKGERCYFNMNSNSYAQKAFLKLLFPLNKN
ncbi:hypothetical protein [Helcococcus kunzii]|uniref:Uncharacterized protein n=1 Tax=Helcococcus kunzii ATCC 51366 TaxID=883114 RepID=H3NLX7_9FIRM|nr:hypothetical protein [Helcococcus kunzii]EHR35647.1 hypothetical protein HMPREF9709_00338 [Helcococcus kunzii ATCC 51366]MCT1796211.1 hypothetical protein [Helcococcus kunzii]MCT1988934.1 hypothetical protein [Helcococcus kunzii]